MLSCDIEQVISEVTLSMQRLVKKYGMKQHDAAWESILDIASAVQEYVEVRLRVAMQWTFPLLHEILRKFKIGKNITTA